MKFIHTADWQIGMTFHGFKEKSRIMMEDDRLEVIEAIGDDQQFIILTCTPEKFSGYKPVKTIDLAALRGA